jgi:hypothetical protein
VTSPENPEQPEARTEQDVEKKPVVTDTDDAHATEQEPVTQVGDGVSHEQETAKFAVGEPQAGGETVVVEELPDDTVAPSAPPPWQRVTSDNAVAAPVPPTPVPSAQYASEPLAYSEEAIGYQSPPSVDTSSQATTNFRPVVTGAAAPSSAPGAFGLGAEPSAARMSVNIGSAAPRGGGGAAPTALRRPGRGPRRASLQVKRVDPWSVLKLALVLGFAMFLVWMVAVGVLYGVLQGMGVWNKLNGTYNDLVQGGDAGNGDLISVGRVFGIAAVVGLVNVILFTALATVSAFIYNVAADLAGGIEVTLSERE